MYAHAGADFFYAAASDDEINGGDGDDKLKGEGGVDEHNDAQGTDTDKQCGGQDADFLNVYDGDNNDTVWPGGGSYFVNNDDWDVVKPVGESCPF